MNHAKTAPELCRHRMSERPSPLKSPRPTICQDRSTGPEVAAPITFVPSMNHVAGFPDIVFRHRMSDLLSPFPSSRVAATESANALLVLPVLSVAVTVILVAPS